MGGGGTAQGGVGGFQQRQGTMYVMVVAVAGGDAGVDVVRFNERNKRKNKSSDSARAPKCVTLL